MHRDFDSRLGDVMQAHGDRTLLDSVYDDWAREYDRDLWASGNPYFSVLAAMTARYVPDRSATILDCGCGTGLVGELRPNAKPDFAMLSLLEREVRRLGGGW